MGTISDRARAAAAHWSLSLGQPLVGGSRSAVYEARDSSGRDVVLKLPATRADQRNPAADEAAALACWEGAGATVTMIDATPDALLLARVRPGTRMTWRPEAPVTDTVEAIAELLGRLWAAPAGAYPFRTLAESYSEDERVARSDAAFEQRERGEPDRGMPGVSRLPAAATAAENLIRSTENPVLLHGDFITKNLVCDGSSPVGWVAIDPLPMTGDPAAEVASFAAYQPAEVILPTAEALAISAGVNPRRALEWQRSGRSTRPRQAWRDDQQALERLVESGTIAALLRNSAHP
jgi:streptomycin 6-kinase